MRRGFLLGELFGIRIRVDWSWLVIFFLTSWNLATAFGNIHSGWGTVMRWGVAIVAALLFFASVLAHEMAHSLVAKARDVPVNSITLHLFGGVSNIEREPDSPNVEFLMAIVGPATSIGLGLILLLILSLTMQLPQADLSNPKQAFSQLGAVSTLALWLGSVNIMVGLFNLIPGFPLDGGRVLRAIFWALTDNLRRATKWVSWIGRGIAWLMILSGISMTFGANIPLLGGGLADGLWLAFIGWFLHNAATQSYQRLIVREALEELSVGELMRQEPPLVEPTCTVADLVHNRIMQSDDYAFPVMEDEHLVGLVTLDDVRAVNRETWSDKRVRDIMTPAAELMTAAPNDNVRDALDNLARKDVRQLPVVQNGLLQGLLRRRDILKWLQLETDLV